MIDKSYLSSLTQEERDALRKRAQESRIAKTEAAANIRVSSEIGYWRDLASKHGVRMPQSSCQSNEHKFPKRIARKLDVDINVWIKDIVGAKNMKEISDTNPDIGAVGMCGLLLEWIDEVKQ